MSLLLLFQNPPQINESIDLFIYGHAGEADSVSLFIAGPLPGETGLNLFLSGAEPAALNASLDLSVNGVSPGVGGQFNSITLHMVGGSFTNQLNLYLETVASDINTKPMNLFVKGNYPVSNGTLPLYLQNDTIAKILNLFIKGTGSSAGGLPYSNSLNLFLQKMPSEMIPLYLRGPFEDTAESITMFIGGATISTNSVDLVIASTKGEEPAILKLYTNGF